MKFTIYTAIALALTRCADKPPVAGTWRFVADQQIDDNGIVVKEDTEVDGLLIYTAQGDMSVQLLWKGTRTPIMSDSIMQFDGMSTGLGLGKIHGAWRRVERSLIRMMPILEHIKSTITL